MSRLLWWVPLVLAACNPVSDGLRETPEGDGPMVVVDWDATPLPELPLPNDLATRPDPTSPTGVRVNISVDAASTQLEADTRAKIDELTGWGIYMPITVRFDQPLDLDNIATRQQDDGDFSDDALYLIDVTPGTSDYLKPVALDVGSGRFPQDVADAGAYFPNDPHLDSPSLLFDLHDEDKNGNGQLDWGEDVDNDGYLDVPNVYPDGGDPRFDLLTWYEKVTNTLILRPDLPLHEEATYAVVLTDRLVGTDGNPVRSPWKYVNHTRQTAALAPLQLAMPQLGLTMDQVAFAWTFTTGRETGDLVDLRRSLDGEGPFDWLPKEVPPAVSKADVMQEIPGNDNPYVLPVSSLTNLLTAVDLVDPATAPMIAEGYSHASGLVGGHFTTPFLLADKDDGGGDTTDEWWEIDPEKGTAFYAPQDVAFTCVLPKPTADRQAPFDVAIYGHGYGSSRFEAMSFAWVWARLGGAVCMMDFPGHGLSLSQSDLDQIGPLLEVAGLTPLLEHLKQGRDSDTDNDGQIESGNDQWTADAFHTRDQVRQAVLDWFWLIRSIENCGTGTMDVGGEQRTSCDWDGDGQPDIGGPNAHILLAGGSLGGIIDGVAAAVNPDVDVNVPIVSGAGLMDVSTRAPTGGAVQAMEGKIMSPLFLGHPQSDGSLQNTEMVDNFRDMIERPIGTLPSTDQVVGGKVVVENLDNGEVREGWIPDGTWVPNSTWSGPAPGAFRIGIPADALDYFERRAATGMPETGPEEGVEYTAPDNVGLGDRLKVTFYDRDGNEVDTIDTFDQDVEVLGVTYKAGSPLVALQSGYGQIGASPDFRRLLSVVSMVVEPGDPIAYAPHYLKEPFEALGGKQTNVLLVPSPGDMVVAVNAEIANARAAGLWPLFEPDSRYGESIDHFLIDKKVVHGLEEFGPYTCNDGSPCLFDADDLDNGTDDFGAPSSYPLRVTRATSSGISGMRLPYVAEHGIHGIRSPNPNLSFDMSMFVLNQVARYMTTYGQVLTDDPCMQDNSCDWIPTSEGSR